MTSSTKLFGLFAIILFVGFLCLFIPSKQSGTSETTIKTVIPVEHAPEYKEIGQIAGINFFVYTPDTAINSLRFIVNVYRERYSRPWSVGGLQILFYSRSDINPKFPMDDKTFNAWFASYDFFDSSLTFIKNGYIQKDKASGKLR